MTELTYRMNISKSHQAPNSFELSRFRLEKEVFKSRKKIWQWLNRMETFSEGQTFPYVVEFVDPKQNKQAEFKPGTLTNHYGPGLNVAGVIGEMKPYSYRDLQYFYGSYVFLFRLVRPRRLQIWLEEGKTKDSTVLIMQLDVWVRPWFTSVWELGQSYFWNRFMRWVERKA